MFVTYLFQKLLQNYKKCFIYTTILSKKCFARKTFITKSVLHAQQIAYISVIFNISKIAFRLEVRGERLKAGTLSLSLLTHEVLISLRSNDYFVGTPIIEPKFVER